ncbi:MAG: hypothetical protein RL095_3894 [Verrucomicrobiota bacterium]|jgi:sugar phosphate isomerase/epimerase
MDLSRRQFVAAAGLAGLMSPVLKAENAAVPSGTARLTVSAQPGHLGGGDWMKKFARARDLGLDAVEIGGGGLPGQAKEIRAASQASGLPVTAVCAGFQGWAIASDAKVRQQFEDSMKRLLEGAGEIGSAGVIYVPAFHGQAALPDIEARKLLTGFTRWDRKDEGKSLLHSLGDFAKQHKTRLLLEPLNRDETYFVRTVAEGASICRDVDNEGCALMADLWHMTWEETSDYGAILSGARWLHHVHIASRRQRALPGSDGDADDYTQGFKALKQIGYQGAVSLECRGGDEASTKAAIALIRKQWAEA